MIQVADTGVGIMGQEGMQVVCTRQIKVTSDYISNLFSIYSVGPAAPQPIAVFEGMCASPCTYLGALTS